MEGGPTPPSPGQPRPAGKIALDHDHGCHWLATKRRLDRDVAVIDESCACGQTRQVRRPLYAFFATTRKRTGKLATSWGHSRSDKQVAAGNKDLAIRVTVGTRVGRHVARVVLHHRSLGARLLWQGPLDEVPVDLVQIEACYRCKGPSGDYGQYCPFCDAALATKFAR